MSCIYNYIQIYTPSVKIFFLILNGCLKNMCEPFFILFSYNHEMILIRLTIYGNRASYA